jgi:hypothetical protein
MEMEMEREAEGQMEDFAECSNMGMMGRERL